MVLKFESEKDFKEMGRDSHRTPFVGMLQAIGLTCLSPQLSKICFFLTVSAHSVCVYECGESFSLY